MAMTRSRYNNDLPDICGKNCRRQAPSMNPSELAKQLSLKEAELNLRNKFHALCMDKFH